MNAEALVTMKFLSQDGLLSVIAAILPETRKTIGSRARVEIEAVDCLLRLRIEAEDATALRTPLNVYLRWINSTMSVVELLEDSL